MRNALTQADIVIGGILGLVILLLTVWIVNADCSSFVDLFKQINAQKFSETTGEIVRDQVAQKFGSKGSRTIVSYHLDLEYKYQVYGKEYHSSIFRYGINRLWRLDWSSAFVTAHPEGAAILIFYNPRDPEQSILMPGINGDDLVALFPLCGFNAIILLFWSRFCSWLRTRAASSAVAGVSIISQAGQTRVRLPRHPPVVVGLVSLAVLSFSSALIIGMSLAREPSVREASLAWFIVIAISASLFIACLIKLNAGNYDLIINDQTSTITLPRTFGRKHRTAVGLDKVCSVMLQEVRSKNYYCCYPTVRFQMIEPTEARLAAWSDKRRGEAFVGWLQNRLHPMA